MIEANYTLMCKDVPVCDVVLAPEMFRIVGLCNLHDERYAPVAAVRGGHIDELSLMAWWAGRFVPAERLPRALEARETLVRLLEESHGATLTDQYWVRPIGSGLIWGEVNYYENDFDETMGRELLGTMTLSHARGMSLDNPSPYVGGAVRKYWRVGASGERQLVKSSGAAGREPVNEMAASAALGELLSSNRFVRYELEEIDGEQWSVCAAFTDGSHEYVPMDDLLGQEPLGASSDGVRQVVRIAEGLSVQGFEQELVDMLVFDALIGNNDRHLGNFGLVRCSDDLSYTIAPIFDNGYSLFCPAEHHKVFAPFDRNVLEQLESLPTRPSYSVQDLTRAVDAGMQALLNSGVDAGAVEAIATDMARRLDTICSWM